MKKASKTVVFFGSGPVAAKSLRLLAKHAVIEAVITKPKPAHHKGSFPVIDTANELGLKTYLVTSKVELNDLVRQKIIRSRLGVLIDFGIIISQEVINYFPDGIINSHFSILPEWRGADPITFSILSGQKITGVSLMLLVEKMDEGPLIGYGEQPIHKNETTPGLTKKLILLSDTLLQELLPQYLSHKNTVPQTITGRNVSYSHRLKKENGVIDWHKPAVDLERQIRAYLDWPQSKTKLANLDVIITSAKVSAQSLRPGEIAIDKNRLFVGCGKHSLEILQLKPAGKRVMEASAFLAGYKKLLSG